MKLDQIHHVAIIASNYEASRAFYVDKLGLSVVREVYREERNDHILTLQVGKFFGNIVSIDSLVTRHKVLLLIFCHKLEETAPLILDPYCIEILVICTENKHNLSTVERRKNIRLILNTELIFKRDS